MSLVDIDELIPIVQYAWNNTSIGCCSDDFDEESTRNKLKQIYIDPSYYSLIYELDGFICGVMIVREACAPVNENSKYVIEICWDADVTLSEYSRGRTLIELFRYMKKLLKDNGLSKIIIGVKAGNSLQYYLERHGATIAEVMYLMKF